MLALRWLGPDARVVYALVSTPTYCQNDTPFLAQARSAGIAWKTKPALTHFHEPMALHLGPYITVRGALFRIPRIATPGITRFGTD